MGEERDAEGFGHIETLVAQRCNWIEERLEWCSALWCFQALMRAFKALECQSEHVNCRTGDLPEHWVRTGHTISTVCETNVAHKINALYLSDNLL